jgi:dihydroorotate dehydrogenase
MYDALRPFLFRLDPETAHRLTLGLLRWAGDMYAARELLHHMYAVQDSRLQVRAFGLEFKNPVGLAAGYDKNGIAVLGLAALGFGHLELGTLTPRPQAGHDRPRVWRSPEATALVNRMGFPNDGVERLTLPSRDRFDARLGLNLGKGSDTPLESAANDYVLALHAVYERADYIAINVSSPNTAGLRTLQARDAIGSLLRAIADARDAKPRRLPLLVKIAPDLSFPEIDDVIRASRGAGFDGVIATNTTIRRDGAPSYTQQWPGGMSGVPLRRRSTEITRYIAESTHGEFPIIGVGGICDAESALEKLQAGASLVQVFTGLVYGGPALVRRINTELLKRDDWRLPRPRVLTVQEDEHPRAEGEQGKHLVQAPDGGNKGDQTGENEPHREQQHAHPVFDSK